MDKEILLKLEQKLEKCKDNDLDNIDKNMLEDISKINVDVKKSSIERILDFLIFYKNPYLFKVDNMIVEIQFKNKSYIQAQNAINNVFTRMYLKTK